ncbi:MAG: hypothetical protein WB392_12150 [Methanotrichaceae archaeon]
MRLILLAIKTYTMQTCELSLEDLIQERTHKLEATNARLQAEITEFKRMEEEILRPKDELAQRFQKRTAELLSAEEVAEAALHAKSEFLAVMSLLSFKAKTKGLDIACSIDRSTPETLISDQIRLRQVLLNLLDNAIKFTDKGGIDISVSGRNIEDGMQEYPFLYQRYWHRHIRERNIEAFPAFQPGGYVKHPQVWWHWTWLSHLKRAR